MNDRSMSASPGNSTGGSSRGGSGNGADGSAVWPMFQMRLSAHTGPASGDLNRRSSTSLMSNGDRLPGAQRGSRHMAVTVGAPLPTTISPVDSNPCRA
jgi:hypothetical protein